MLDARGSCRVHLEAALAPPSVQHGVMKCREDIPHRLWQTKEAGDVPTDQTPRYVCSWISCVQELT